LNCYRRREAFKFDTKWSFTLNIKVEKSDSHV
jgi:hypothetical protein